MTANIKITKPVLGDENEIASLLKETWLTTYVNKKYRIGKKDILSKDFDSKKKLAKWRKAIVSNGKCDYICVAKSDKKVIGICTAKKEKVKNKIGAIYVLTAYQRKGVGKKLLTRCVQWLGADKDIKLRAASFNRKAINFYVKNGFSILDKPFYYKELPNGKKFPLIEMELIQKSQK